MLQTCRTYGALMNRINLRLLLTAN